MKPIIKRLEKGVDLKKEILKLAKELKLTSGVMLGAVGSLSKATLRMPVIDGHIVEKKWNEELEIVSVTGNITANGEHCHIHISFSDINGNCFGGHLQDGCISKTTIELVILTFEDLTFLTPIDPKTGFNELVVKQLPKTNN